jgi:hypothetical protein
MHPARLLLFFVLLTAVAAVGFLAIERLTVQELTRTTQPATGEAAVLIWKPRLLRGDGRCVLELRSAQDKALDSVELAILPAGLEALQQFGGIDFQGSAVRIVRGGEIVREFTVRDNRLRMVQ